MGTFKSGADNVQLHHWSSCKPAQLRPDAVEAEMPTRGRPKKPPSGPYNGQNQTEPAALVNKPAVKSAPKSPTRRSERIRNKNHETSIVNVGELSLFPAEAGNSNADSIKLTGPPPNRAFSPVKAWSASKYDLDIINRSITHKSIVDNYVYVSS